jgi:hypothetical protein
LPAPRVKHQIDSEKQDEVFRYRGTSAALAVEEESDDLPECHKAARKRSS